MDGLVALGLGLGIVAGPGLVCKPRRKKRGRKAGQGETGVWAHHGVPPVFFGRTDCCSKSDRVVV